MLCAPLAGTRTVPAQQLAMTLVITLWTNPHAHTLRTVLICADNSYLLRSTYYDVLTPMNIDTRETELAEANLYRRWMHQVRMYFVRSMVETSNQTAGMAGQEPVCQWPKK